MNNTIESNGNLIVIQSCDTEVANIGVFSKGKCAYHHVGIPELNRQGGATRVSYLPTTEYDQILAEHRQDILRIVKTLG